MNLRVLLPLVRLLALGLLAAPFAPGCETSPPDREEPKPAPASPEPVAKKILLGPNVYLEVQGKRRRVLVNAEVCLQKGMLELFLCRKDSKEHESIVHADVDARDIHKALLAAGAETGSPVRYEPKFSPPAGTTIKVGVEYEEKGRRIVRPAREWVRYCRTNKELDMDWVFAGSELIENPYDKTKPKIYLANAAGCLITVSNFVEAMLDLPINSSKDNAELSFETYSERIPPPGTNVVVTLEPVLPEKKGK